MKKAFFFTKIIKYMIVFAMFANLVTCQSDQQIKKTQKVIETNSQPIPNQQPKKTIESLEPIYTENIQQFKTVKYNARLQILVGCWLMVKEYIQKQKSDYLFSKNQETKDVINLKLVKQCMKIIKRKDAVLKVTQLVGKNMEQAKKYQDIVLNDRINEILIQHNQINIMSLNQKQNFDNQIIIGMNNGSTSLNQQKQIIGESIQAQEPMIKEKQRLQQKYEVIQQKKQNQSKNPQNDFDGYLMELLKKYEVELGQLMNSKGGLKGKVEEQLKSRGKYYFGFIPANTFTHSLFLITISLMMVCCCTCYKYYKKRTQETKDKKKQGHDHSHSHSHGKTLKKISKMTEITMSRKTK